MRWTSASAVLLVVLYASASALAQSRDQQLIDEVTRKAEAAEMEQGFCATTGWGPISQQAYTAFLASTSVGSGKVNRFDNGQCEFNRVTRIHTENGGKCVTYSFWACPKGERCGKGAKVDCLNSAGVFVSRRDAP